MGGASLSEGDFENLWNELRNFEESPVSLSDIVDRKAKRHRSTNWTPDERTIFLEAMSEAVRGTMKGRKLWQFISKRVLRSTKECENNWGTLRKAHRAIEQHEKRLGGGPQTSVLYPCSVSYFEMDEESRASNKFLPLPCYKLMQDILEEQKMTQRSANHAGTSHTVDSVVEEDHGTQLFIQRRLELFAAEQCEVVVNSSFDSLGCQFSEADSQKISTMLTPDVMQHIKAKVTAAVIFDFKVLASKGYRFDAHDPTAGLAPFVANFVKDALKSAIERMFSLEVLEERQKRRHDIIERRRALDQEEKELEESEWLQHVLD